MKIYSKFLAVLCALFGLVAGAANAAFVTTDITAAITDASAAISVVGLAVLVMFVGAKVFKWVRRAL